MAGQRGGRFVFCASINVWNGFYNSKCSWWSMRRAEPTVQPVDIVLSHLTPRNLGCSPGADVSVSIFRESMWAMDMTVAATYHGSPMKEQIIIRMATQNRSKWYPAPFWHETKEIRAGEFVCCAFLGFPMSFSECAKGRQSYKAYSHIYTPKAVVSSRRR